MYKMSIFFGFCASKSPKCRIPDLYSVADINVSERERVAGVYLGNECLVGHEYGHQACGVVL